MNKITDFSRTIIALATALGSGSIAVIRMSGPKAIDIADTVFRGKELRSVPANTVHFGRIVDADREFDHVLVSVFHAPNSYTGENYIEISCHANPYIVDDIMAVLMDHGAQAAMAGEFTLRAFLNGKMDLSQAEAVAGIIKAKSRFGIKNSLNQLNGKLTAESLNIRKELIDIIGLLEIDLDFSEENIEIATKSDLVSKLIKIEKRLTELKSSYNYAKLLEGGILLTIIGEPNVGKSTLLNQLLGENRAITSHIPGTTRDTIHENLVINDILFKLIDTAGLRKAKDELETEGIKRAKSQVSMADMVLLVVDSSEKISDTSWKLIKETFEEIRAQIVIVANKKDLGINLLTYKKLLSLDESTVKISAKTGSGLKELEAEIMKKLSHGYDKFSDDLIITSKRQIEVMKKTRGYIHSARLLLEKEVGFEFVTIDIRQALNVLGEITGETATDDILNNIFANFCIGK